MSIPVGFNCSSHPELGRVATCFVDRGRSVVLVGSRDSLICLFLFLVLRDMIFVFANWASLMLRTYVSLLSYVAPEFFFSLPPKIRPCTAPR